MAFNCKENYQKVVNYFLQFTKSKRSYCDIPMGPIQIAIAVWLIVKGFNERLEEPTAKPSFK